MSRKLWIVTMAFIALVAAGGSSASARAADACRAPGSLCTTGPNCCSLICTCSFNDACVCD